MKTVGFFLVLLEFQRLLSSGLAKQHELIITNQPRATLLESSRMSSSTKSEPAGNVGLCLKYLYIYADSFFLKTIHILITCHLKDF